MHGRLSLRTKRFKFKIVIYQKEYLTNNNSWRDGIVLNSWYLFFVLHTIALKTAFFSARCLCYVYIATFWLWMVVTLPSSVYVVFNIFLLIDATDRGKISSSDRKRLFFDLSLHPLSFFAVNPLLFFVNTPFKVLKNRCESVIPLIF